MDLIKVFASNLLQEFGTVQEETAKLFIQGSSGFMIIRGEKAGIHLQQIPSNKTGLASYV